uniref:Uncharacterized protein n=1 Tax=Arundo donax TaxID=35708 RepID=A0A0A9FPJ3_ARUDO
MWKFPSHQRRRMSFC